MQEIKIQSILNKYCNKYDSTSNNIDLTPLKLEFIVIDKVSYISNIPNIAMLISRTESNILSSLKEHMGLKIYTTQYKNQELKGMILTPRDKLKLNKIFYSYLESIKCIKCNSRFTIIKDSKKVCTSCGYI
jgi:hypothetical protein